MSPLCSNVLYWSQLAQAGDNKITSPASEISNALHAASATFSACSMTFIPASLAVFFGVYLLFLQIRSLLLLVLNVALNQ